MSVLAQKGPGPIIPGAERPGSYLGMLEGKRLGIVANQTTRVGETHLVDFLLGSGVGHEQILAVFAPEHGFRGRQSAGASVKDGLDEESGLRIISLYGKNKKPPAGLLQEIDLMIFDIQDVGARFYTYISTLHLVMEACAEAGVTLLVLDRPNPNGDYVDGPVLDTAFRSFVGMHPIPVVHGLTMAELALMINGEGWLSRGMQCELDYIPCKDYRHDCSYELPVPPSPNLQNSHAIRLYPSTCFFEGTVLSEGRGTPWPFELYGHPALEGEFRFTPRSIAGVADHPSWEGELCRGRDLRAYEPPGGDWMLDLEILLEAYREFPEKDAFFNAFFDKLAGTNILRRQIREGWSAKQIRQSWEEDLINYQKLREKYLIYE